jgi:hypothetical protein
MAKRRKKLKQKILTYGEIDARITRHYKKHKNKDCTAPLYGSVSVQIPAISSNHFQIVWYGNLRRAGGPSVNRIIRLASVFALSDGDTGYVVPGIGKVRNNTEEDQAMIKIWRRYIGAFTPHDPTDRILQKWSHPYRLRDGKAVPLTDCHWAHPCHPIMLGCWWLMPTVNRPDWNRWLHGWDDEFKGFPKFLARSKRFANDLRKRLADGPTAVVQLLHRNEGFNFGFHEKGLQLHVCLPPTRTQEGERLVIQGAMHTKESRQFHHVDGDYAPRHSQYFAWRQGDPKSQVMRWKCGKDALNGIVEWVLSSIHIPGPE